MSKLSYFICRKINQTITYIYLRINKCKFISIGGFLEKKGKFLDKDIEHLLYVQLFDFVNVNTITKYS